MHFELTGIKFQMSSLCTLFNIRFEMPIMSDAIKLIIHAAVYCNIRCSSCTDCIQSLKEYDCFFLRGCNEYCFQMQPVNRLRPSVQLTQPQIKALPFNTSRFVNTSYQRKQVRYKLMHLKTALCSFTFYLLNCAFRSKCSIILVSPILVYG